MATLVTLIKEIGTKNGIEKPKIPQKKKKRDQYMEFIFYIYLKTEA